MQGMQNRKKKRGDLKEVYMKSFFERGNKYE